MNEGMFQKASVAAVIALLLAACATPGAPGEVAYFAPSEGSVETAEATGDTADPSPDQAGAADDADAGATTAKLQVWLTATPGDFQAAPVTIDSVEVYFLGTEGQAGAGWVVLADQPVTYDLQELRYGWRAALASASIPPGRYTQIRLTTNDPGGLIFDHDLEVVSGADYALVLAVTPALPGSR